MSKAIDPQMELITPAKAEKYLNANKSNRSLRQGVVERYEADMKAGAWTQCVAPIAFYEDGDVADGQHRLWAIVASQIPQKFIVVRGLKREDGLNIDTGLGRSLVDNARISGTDPDLSHALIATCKAIELGDKVWGANTNAERLAFVERHREAGNWAIAHGPKGSMLRNTLTLAAVGRAWYHEADKLRLEHFGEVVTSGFATGGECDFAAVALRQFLIDHGRSASSTAQWRPMFLRVQNALWYFMRNRKLTVVKGIEDERYPLIGKPIKLAARTRKIGKVLDKKNNELKEAKAEAKAERKAKPLAGPDKFEVALRGNGRG